MQPKHGPRVRLLTLHCWLLLGLACRALAVPPSIIDYADRFHPVVGADSSRPAGVVISAPG